MSTAQAPLVAMSGRLDVTEIEGKLSCMDLSQLTAKLRSVPDELVSNSQSVAIEAAIGHGPSSTMCTWSSSGIVSGDGLVGLDISLKLSDELTNGSYVFYTNSRDVPTPHLKIGKTSAFYNSLAIELYHPRVAVERAHSKATKEFKVGNIDLAISYYDAAYAYVRLEKYLQGKVNGFVKQKKFREASDVYAQVN